MQSKDNLGSWNVISDSIGNIVQRVSFDAWGRRRNATDWSYNNINGNLRFDRGYTGHEHIQAFNLINMNGRMYDPAVGRFLSPDIFADAGSTQGMNSYSYCLNNPLMYSDPSGWIATNIGLAAPYQGNGSFVVPNWDVLGLFSTDVGGSCSSGGFGAGCGQSFGDVSSTSQSSTETYSYTGDDNKLHTRTVDYGPANQGWGGRGPDRDLGGHSSDQYVQGADGNWYARTELAKLVAANSRTFAGTNMFDLAGEYLQYGNNASVTVGPVVPGWIAYNTEAFGSFYDENKFKYNNGYAGCVNEYKTNLYYYNGLISPGLERYEGDCTGSSQAWSNVGGIGSMEGEGYLIRDFYAHDHPDVGMIIGDGPSHSEPGTDDFGNLSKPSSGWMGTGYGSVEVSSLGIIYIYGKSVEYFTNPNGGTTLTQFWFYISINRANNQTFTKILPCR